MTMRAWRNLTLQFGVAAIPLSIAPAKASAGRVEGHTYDRATRQRVKRAWLNADGDLTATDDTCTLYGDDAGELFAADDVALPTEPTLTLQAILPLGEVDPLLYDSAYAVWAGKGGAAGFGLIATVLRDDSSVLAGQACFTKGDRMRSVLLRWSPALGSVCLHTLTYSEMVKATDAQAAIADLTTPDDVTLTQGRALIDALPTSWSPADADPLQAAIVAAMTAQGAQVGNPVSPDLDDVALDLTGALRADVKAARARLDDAGKAGKGRKANGRKVKA
jgi:non-homologous end joining protein Ku